MDLELLRHTDLFQDLTKEELGKLTGISVKETFDSGKTIFEEGDRKSVV